MNKPTLNAAVASSLLDDISHQFMVYHDEINDLKVSDDKYDIDLLLIKYFGSHAEERHLPLIRAILTNICEYTSLLYEAEDELNIELVQLEFEFYKLQ